MQTCLFPIKSFILYLEEVHNTSSYLFIKVFYKRLHDILKKYVSIMEYNENTTVDDKITATNVAINSIKETKKIFSHHLENEAYIGNTDRTLLNDFDYSIKLLTTCKKKLSGGKKNA